jgi:hypothetical protein
MNLVLRSVAALTTAGVMLFAQAGNVSVSATTAIMSPTVVATWYAHREGTGANRLQLVILWRGSVAWWAQPGCIGSCGSADYTVKYGSVRLTVQFDPVKESVTVNGRDIALRGDNVLYIDSVDAPVGPRFLRTSHIDPQMPGTFGQIGSLLANSHEVMEYMQCGARRGDAAVDARLAVMCITNLGRQ